MSSSSPDSTTPPAQAKAYLVESIPKGLEDLRGTPRIQYTEDVLVRLVGAATATIDLTAMYWSLLPDPNGPDESGFTPEQFAQMGAGTGKALYDALAAAAARGVKIRILQSPGFSGAKQESDTLRDAYPNAITIGNINMPDWYGGGIMHQKLWIFDRRDLYLGSANMDWKSIMQVKEMGVAVENCPAFADDATIYFESWWLFASLKAANATACAFDPGADVFRQVPAWSNLVSEAVRQPSPLAGFATKFNRHHPLATSFDGAPAGVFLTGCPREVKAGGRTYDGTGLVHTLNDARKSIAISVMDFAPVGLYSRTGGPTGPDGTFPNDTPVWWRDLFDALLAAALTRKVHVRLLVSKWAHTSPFIEPFLRALQATADAGRINAAMNSGQLEIKQFIIPGWDSTAGKYRSYPGHSRVNHTKYIATDRRINIGTSNMTWDYFASTAGCSFNTDHVQLRQDLQAVFDRDWSSSYAFRLT